MEATYYKDSIRSYMIIPCPPEAVTESYQYRMLEMNRIEGLLPCGLRYIDGERFLYYDTTGKLSLRGLYEGRKLPGAELFKLLGDIEKVCGSLAGYLLDEQHVVLSEEQIFYDFGSGNYCFTYYPGAVTVPEVFRFLTEVIEAEDKRAAASAYRLCAAADGSRQALREAIREEADPRDPSDLWAEEPDPLETKRPLETQKPTDAPKTDLKSPIGRERPFIKEKDEAPQTRPETKQEKETALGKKQLLIEVLLILLLLGGAGALIAVPFLLYISQRERRLCTAGAILLFAAAGLMIAELIIKANRHRRHRQNKEQRMATAYSESDEKDMPLFGTAGREEYRIKDEDECNTIRFSEQETTGRLYGRDRGNRIDLRTLPITIGKAQAYSDIVLGDPSVSRVHARIYRGEDGCIEIRDLNSTNGTWINGVRLEPNEKRRVQRGDEVRFGSLEYEYR